MTDQGGRASEDTRSIVERVDGAAVGLGAGDAMTWAVARLTPEIARNRISTTAQPHSALTTWALALADALRFRSHDVSLQKALMRRLFALAGPRRGAALRHAPRGFGATLRQVARALENGEDARLAGIDDVVADPIPALTPLAFTLNDTDDDVAEAIVATLGVTHRALRVFTSGGLFVGGLRAQVRHRTASRKVIFGEAMALAERVQEKYGVLRDGVVVGRPLEAEGARAMALAAANHAQIPSDLWAPVGLDGRDSPERCVFGALVGLAMPATEAVAMATERAACGGDADVTIPMWLAGLGAGVGRDRLPLGMTGRLSTTEMVCARLRSLVEASPLAREDLAVEELGVSAAVDDTATPLEAAAQINAQMSAPSVQPELSLGTSDDDTDA